MSCTVHCDAEGCEATITGNMGAPPYGSGWIAIVTDEVPVQHAHDPQCAIAIVRKLAIARETQRGATGTEPAPRG